MDSGGSDGTGGAGGGAGSAGGAGGGAGSGGLNGSAGADGGTAGAVGAADAMDGASAGADAGGGGADGGADATDGSADGADGGTAPHALFVVSSNYDLPINNPNNVQTLEPTFSYGDPASYGFGVTSSIGPNSITTTLQMSNNTCTQNNGVLGTAQVQVYVAGDAGTPYVVDYSWAQDVSAASTGSLRPQIGAVTTYSSFGSILANAANGTSDSTSSSGQGTAVGATTGPTITSGGLTYSLAVMWNLYGDAGTNGQCYDCSNDCCDCGVSTVISSLTATAQLAASNCVTASRVLATPEHHAPTGAAARRWMPTPPLPLFSPPGESHPRNVPSRVGRPPPDPMPARTPAPKRWAAVPSQARSPA